MSWMMRGMVGLKSVLPVTDQAYVLYDVDWSFTPYLGGSRLSKLVDDSKGTVGIYRHSKAIGSLENLLDKGVRAKREIDENSFCFAWFDYDKDTSLSGCHFFVGLSEKDWRAAEPNLQSAMTNQEEVRLYASGSFMSDDHAGKANFPTAHEFEAGEVLALSDPRINVIRKEWLE